MNSMAKKDERVDAYIQNAQPFARPILAHLREVVHKACPEVAETMKWSFPHFDYKGMMCSMASFKQHCAFGFWKAVLMKDHSLVETAKSEVAMGHLGKITTLKDLPIDKKLRANIKEAMQLNDDDVKLPARPKTTDKSPVTTPSEFIAAFKRNKAAKTHFEAFSASHRREYIQWVTEAKTEATREKRLAQAMEMLAEGKSRNWKYQKK